MEECTNCLVYRHTITLGCNYSINCKPQHSCNVTKYSYSYFQTIKPHLLLFHPTAEIKSFSHLLHNWNQSDLTNPASASRFSPERGEELWTLPSLPSHTGHKTQEMFAHTGGTRDTSGIPAVPLHGKGVSAAATAHGLETSPWPVVGIKSVHDWHPGDP